MVDKKVIRKPVGRKHTRVSPPPLPPRWGEGVAPPPSPHVSASSTPITSPGYDGRDHNSQPLRRGMISSRGGQQKLSRKQTYENINKYQRMSSASGLPLSYPSPPLLNKQKNIPLTSTLLVSPPQFTRGSQQPSLHPCSPATPELSTIPLKVTDATTYQNYEAGIAYMPTKQQTTSRLPLKTNLSRFNVSPPHNPETATNKGTLENNGKKLGRTQTQWLNEQRSRAQNMLIEPKKVTTASIIHQ